MIINLIALANASFSIFIVMRSYPGDLLIFRVLIIGVTSLILTALRVNSSLLPLWGEICSLLVNTFCCSLAFSSFYRFGDTFWRGKFWVFFERVISPLKTIMAWKNRIVLRISCLTYIQNFKIFLNSGFHFSL